MFMAVKEPFRPRSSVVLTLDSEGPAKSSSRCPYARRMERTSVPVTAADRRLSVMISKFA